MLTLHIAGLRKNIGKSVIAKRLNIARGKITTVPILKLWDTVDCLVVKNIIHFRCFFLQHQTCTATEDIRCPNTMSSVTCSRGKVKFSSSLSSSPANSA